MFPCRPIVSVKGFRFGLSNGFSGIGRGAFHCSGRLPAKGWTGARRPWFLPPLPECLASVLEALGGFLMSVHSPKRPLCT
jgi:hypothetical protein